MRPNLWTNWCKHEEIIVVSVVSRWDSDPHISYFELMDLSFWCFIIETISTNFKCVLYGWDTPEMLRSVEPFTILCFVQYNRQILTLLVCFCLAGERSESMLLIPLSISLDDGQHTAANKALIWVAWSSAFRENMRLQETRCYRTTLKTWKSWALWSSTVCGAEFRAEDQGLMGPLPKHVTLGSINRNGSTMGSFAPHGEAKST